MDACRCHWRADRADRADEGVSSARDVERVGDVLARGHVHRLHS